MRKTNTILVLVLLLLVAVSAMMVASTYAKYTSTISGTGTATVAKWAFTSDNSISNFTVNLSQTPDASTLVNGKIAPGTSGSFQFHLSNATTETGVDFTVALGSITGKPTNLKFYKDSGFSTEITPGSTTITGQLAAKDGTGIDVPIYWKWEYETSAIATNDPIDTSDGETAATLSLPITITGVQTQPSTTAITTHVN